MARACCQKHVIDMLPELAYYPKIGTKAQTPRHMQKDVIILRLLRSTARILSLPWGCYNGEHDLLSAASKYPRFLAASI